MDEDNIQAGSPQGAEEEEGAEELSDGDVCPRCGEGVLYAAGIGLVCDSCGFDIVTATTEEDI
jgi:uncharacterized protein (DUF983 family)